MKNTYTRLPFALLLLLLPLMSWAQTISVPQSPTAAPCVGSVIQVAFTTTGTFAPGNTFRVQLSSNYGTTYVDMPGSFTSSPASITLPAPLTPDTYYIYRIVADKPLTTSGYSSQFKISATPAARLTGSSTGAIPVNAYTPVYLRVTLTGGASYTLTLQDSTQFVKNDDYQSNVGEFLVSPGRTTTYALARVQNACGTGPVSGSVAVMTNTVGFRILPDALLQACRGTALPVYFSTDGPLPANTSFEAELVSSYDNNRTVSLPVSGTSSPLQVQLPAVTTYTDGYRLRIFSRNAGLSAWYRDGSTFTINAAPRLSLLPSSGVPFGGQATLTLSYTSTGQGTAVLSNGQVISLFGSSGYEGGSTTTFTVKPTVTTSYSLVSYSGACSDGIQYGNRSVTVQVRPGLRIDSLSTSEVCAGQPVTLYYTASPGYVLPQQLRVRATNYTALFTVDAQVTRPGQLTFTPPLSASPGQAQTLQIRQADVDTLLAQANLPFTNKLVRPSFTFSNTQLTVSQPGEQSVGVSVFGGGSTRVTLSNGYQFVLKDDYGQGYIQTSLPIYVSETTTFSVLSAVNECGSSVSSSAMTVTVRNADTPSAGLFIRSVTPNRTEFCAGSVETINVKPTGTFGADNQFQLELSDRFGTFSGTPILSFTKAEPISFTLPAQGGSYRVRVSSTNPVTRSNEQSVYISGSTVSAALTLQAPSGVSGASALTVTPGMFINANYTFSGRSPYRYELLDGTTGTTTGSLQLVYQPTANTTYGVRRVTDACGLSTTQTSGQTTVTLVSTLLKTASISSAVCVQAPVQVAFSQFGSVPMSASYVVQASEDQVTWQTLPTTGTTSPLVTLFPASLANRQVYYRVAYVANGVVIVAAAPYNRLLVSTVPNVLLTTPSAGTVVQLDRANSTSVELRILETGSDGTVVLVNGTNAQTLSTYASGRSIYISQPGTYSLVSAYNSCGFGQWAGTVRVTVKPYLSLAKLDRPTACTGQPVSFSYAVAGDLAAGSKLSVYLFDNYNSQRPRQLLAQDAALSGVISFSLNPALTPGSYQLQVEASGPLTTLNGGSLFVDAPINATFVSGARVVYEGDVMGAFIRSNATGAYSLTMATPTGPSVIAGASFSNFYFSFNVTKTGSYSIAAIANQCGAGRATGIVSVTAIPVATVTIRPYVFTDTYCTGKQYTVDLNTTGVFSTTNTFTAYVADSAGQNARAVPTISTPTRLTITIPDNFPAGTNYILRIGSDTPQHLGSSPSQSLSVRQTPTGMLTGTKSIFKGDSTRISVALTGTPPWQLTITDLFGPRVFTAATSPFELTVKPDSDIGYRLTNVRDNQCGVGTATGTALITVAVLLATEPALPLGIRAWPNPTAGGLQVEGEMPGAGTLSLRLHNELGRLVQQQTVQLLNGRVSKQLDISQLPVGTYILTAEQDGYRTQFKVLKY